MYCSLISAPLVSVGVVVGKTPYAMWVTVTRRGGVFENLIIEGDSVFKVVPQLEFIRIGTSMVFHGKAKIKRTWLGPLR